MDHIGTYRYLKLVTWLAIVFFIAGRVVGGRLGTGAWSFAHWDHLPQSYVIGWFIGALVVIVVLGRFLPAIAAFFEPRRNAVAGGVLLVAAMWLLQYNSFLYADGNLRVAQIAQTGDVIFPWYEYGTISIVRLLDHFWDLLGLHYNVAGVYAWRSFSFICTVLALVAAWRLARLLSDDPTRRLGLFLILFFGPQLAVYFGFIGTAPVIAAVSLWFAYGIALAARHFSVSWLVFVWGLVVLGVVLHAAAIYLVPAAAAITIAVLLPRLRSGLAPFCVGVAVLVALTAGLYMVADGHLLLKSALLLNEGKPPHGDYALFSLRHLSDVGQLVFLLFPLLVVAIYLFLLKGPRVLLDPVSAGALLMGLGGLTAVLVMDPVNSAVLDLPDYAPFLASGAIFLAFALRAPAGGGGVAPAALGLVAAASIVLPASYLPVYTRIEKAEPFVTAYLDQHNAYYRTGAVALRDAYFYRKDLTKANYWDQQYERKSPDYLNLVGITDFILTKRLDIALPSLNKLIARNPYWAEPRAIYGKVMTEQGRFELAKPQLDTALLLDPYNPGSYRSIYNYYKGKGELIEARKTIERAASLFPSNIDVRIDQMIIEYHTGNLPRAEELAEHLMRQDSSLAYPYVIRGFVLEKKGDLQNAVAHFERFCSLAPEAPEVPQIRKRSNALYLRLHGSGAQK